MAMEMESTAGKSETTNDVNGTRRDPFECLDGDLVRMVIDLLPVETSHTLRLVSRWWKACSEYHNGSFAIKRHFPFAAAATTDFETREEANLAFRRLRNSPELWPAEL